MVSRRFFQTSKIFGSVGLLILVGGCTSSGVGKSKAAPKATAFAPETSVQKRIGVRPIDLPMNSSLPIDHSPLDPTPSVPPPFGHDVGCKDTGYDLWGKNCHTAANSFCNAKTSPCGIVKCDGNPELDPKQGHTFNWTIENGQTCFYNWGDRQCADGTMSPPDMSRDDFAAIVSEFCGDQQEGNTQPLEPGKTVEEPGPMACLEESRLDLLDGKRPTSEEQFQVCLGCCTTRADLWPVEDPLMADQKLKFVTACNNNCRKLDLLDLIATPPPRDTSLADRRGKMCGLAYSYDEGGEPSSEYKLSTCDVCCAYYAAADDFTDSPEEIGACRAACMSETIPELGHEGGCCKVPFSALTGKCPNGYYEYGAAVGTPGNFCLPMSCTQPATVGCAK